MQKTNELVIETADKLKKEYNADAVIICVIKEKGNVHTVTDGNGMNLVIGVNEIRSTISNMFAMPYRLIQMAVLQNIKERKETND